MKVKVKSCPTLCDPMDCSPTGTSVHGILQARILDGLSFPSPGDLPDLGIEPTSPALQADALPSEPPGKPDNTTLIVETEEELKSLLMRAKEESEKAGLKLSIQKTKIMAFTPITSWQIEGEKMEAVTDFTFLGSQITADGDCSHEIKRCLFLGTKAMTNLGSVLKNRNITLPTKVHIVKAMVFLAVMYGCESWTIKKAEHQRIDAFELWCWRSLLRVLDCKETKKIILKVINPEYSLEGQMRNRSSSTLDT